MKVFLLVVTILLLISRIKSTPKMLSKTIYESGLSKSYDEMKKQIDGKDEELLSIVRIVTIVLVWLFAMLITVYYILIGNRFSSNMIMVVLSGLQITTMFLSTRRAMKEFDFVNFDINGKFRRSWFLFNTILDYVYYPMAIYLLIVN